MQLDATLGAPDAHTTYQVFPHARLSVIVLVSEPVSDVRARLRAAAGAFGEVGAEVILACCAEAVQRDEIERLSAELGWTALSASCGGKRGALSELGMSRATGDVIVVRELGRLGDLSWLRAIARVPSAASRRVVPAVANVASGERAWLGGQPAAAGV